jgi:hypothetical protein
VKGLAEAPVQETGLQFPFQLGFAFTVHKAQGHEFHAVFIPHPEMMKMPGQFYTALSRAQSAGGVLVHFAGMEGLDLLTSLHVVKAAIFWKKIPTVIYAERKLVVAQQQRTATKICHIAAIPRKVSAVVAGAKRLLVDHTDTDGAGDGDGGNSMGQYARKKARLADHGHRSSAAGQRAQAGQKRKTASSARRRSSSAGAKGQRAVSSLLARVTHRVKKFHASLSRGTGGGGGGTSGQSRKAASRGVGRQR